MRTLKFSKAFDYTEGHGRSMTSYTPDGGEKRDGVFEVSDKTADAAIAAGVATDTTKAKPTSDGGGAAGGGTTGNK